MTPYYSDSAVTIYHGDCREILPGLSADLVMTDPPYGVGKAFWDAELPFWWLNDVRADVLAITPCLKNLLDYPAIVGTSLVYRWTLAAHVTNGMTLSIVGFGNWIPCLVYSVEGVKLHTQIQDARSFAIRGDMPEHPSPKPLAVMRWLVDALPGETVLDPFAGSGTTLRAAKDLGRKAIGIEIEERYCEIAAKRCAQEVLAL